MGSRLQGLSKSRILTKNDVFSMFTQFIHVLFRIAHAHMTYRHTYYIQRAYIIPEHLTHNMHTYTIHTHIYITQTIYMHIHFHTCHTDSHNKHNIHTQHAYIPQTTHTLTHTPYIIHTTCTYREPFHFVLSMAKVIFLYSLISHGSSDKIHVNLNFW